MVPREHHVRVAVQLHAHGVSQRVILLLHDERSRVGNLRVAREGELPDALRKHELLGTGRLVHGATPFRARRVLGADPVRREVRSGAFDRADRGIREHWLRRRAGRFVSRPKIHKKGVSREGRGLPVPRAPRTQVGRASRVSHTSCLGAGLNASPQKAEVGRGRRCGATPLRVRSSHEPIARSETSKEEP